MTVNTVAGKLRIQVRNLKKITISEATFIEVQVDDIFITDTILLKLQGYRFHQAGFSTPPDARNDFDNTGVMIKSSDLLQVVFPSVKLHLNHPPCHFVFLMFCDAIIAQSCVIRKLKR